MGRPSSTPATSAEKCNTFPVSAWISTSGAPNPSLRRMAGDVLDIVADSHSRSASSWTVGADTSADIGSAAPSLMLDAREDLGCRERVATEREEVGVGGDPVNLEHVRPDFRYELLRPSFADWPPVAPSGFCQYPPVELPGRAHRELGNDLDDRRNHVRR